MPFTDGNITIGTSVDMYGMNTGLKKIQKSFKKLNLVATTALGIGAFVKLGKAALDAASDLQEVQNVVDVSFTKMDKDGNIISDMTWKIEQFADTCIEKFGMSRMAAKQTAGSFMAMGKSMGLSMEEASDMSVKLTGLTGDFASFYNISQDYARVALSAVYTGETETLKRYGIVLTEANLQQYALSQGIETNVKKMDARDKAILRYMYILEATKDMEGDFVRTQNSWANQTRLLQQVWQEFLITLGNGLITVLTPLIQVLNAIIVKLIEFTRQLWIILSNIFGFQLQDITKQASGAAGAVGDLGDEAEETADQVAKSAKKMKKQLATFDELNNLTTPSSSGSSSGSGGGLSLPPVDLGLDGAAKNGIDDFMDNLPDTLRGLGKWIGDKLSAMMEGIDWDSIYEKARNFGTGFADFLNGLFVDTELFKNVGHTVAGALNTAIYAALSFGETFEWSAFGKKLAAGINEFFKTFDWASCAKAINSWVHGLRDAIVGFVTELDWSAIFSGIATFIKNLDSDTLFILLGLAFLKSSLFQAFKKVFVESLVAGITEALGAEAFKEAVKGIGLKFGSLLVKAIPIAAIVTFAALAVKAFVEQWRDGLDKAKTIFMMIMAGIAAGLAAAFIAPIAGVVIVITASLAYIALLIKEHWDDIKAWFGTVLTDLGAIIISILDIWEQFKDKISKSIANAVISLFNKISEIKNTVSTMITIIQNVISTGLTYIKSKWTSMWNDLKVVVTVIFSNIWSSIKGTINSILGGIERMANGVVDGINKVIQTLNNLDIDIPSWVPQYGGQSLGFNIPYMSKISIPKLAKGAVIPPNNEFMAVLGDQKSGTNIEAPLDTIKQALSEVMSQFGGANNDIVIQIDGREIARAVVKQNQLKLKSAGVGLF